MTSLERKYRYQYAKILRDMFVHTLETWESLIRAKLAQKNVKSESVERIINAITQEVNYKLVWKVLAKQDRYDTPFYRKELQELRSLHLDLVVVNNYHCFVTWSVFNQADIERAFLISSEILPFNIDDVPNS